MKCQILFSGKNKKNISKCCLLKFLPRVLRVKVNKIYKILSFIPHLADIPGDKGNTSEELFFVVVFFFCFVFCCF